jgi:hypothetical protein
MSAPGNFDQGCNGSRADARYDAARCPLVIDVRTASAGRVLLRPRDEAVDLQAPQVQTGGRGLGGVEAAEARTIELA